VGLFCLNKQTTRKKAIASPPTQNPHKQANKPTSQQANKPTSQQANKANKPQTPKKPPKLTSANRNFPPAPAPAPAPALATTSPFTAGTGRVALADVDSEAHILLKPPEPLLWTPEVRIRGICGAGRKGVERGRKRRLEKGKGGAMCHGLFIVEVGL